jgi:hypothetical protein
VAARIAENCIGSLDGPVVRVAANDSFVRSAESRIGSSSVHRHLASRGGTGPSVLKPARQQLVEPRRSVPIGHLRGYVPCIETTGTGGGNTNVTPRFSANRLTAVNSAMAEYGSRIHATCTLNS